MSVMIPETMPEDWVAAASAAHDVDPYDPEVVERMESAYRVGLEELNVSGMMVALKQRCIDAAATPAETPDEPT